MKMEPLTHCKSKNNSRHALLSALFLLTILPRQSYAQSSDVSSQIVTSIPTMTTQTLTTSGPPETLTTSFTPLISASAPLNTTTSSVTSAKPPDTPPPLFPPAGPAADRYNPETEQSESVFNYYFLILAVFGVFVAVSLWWVRRRRKRRKEMMRLSGQNALARDLDGWVNTRRWIHGAWRHGQTAAFVRREEGLNEHGEAPPPYQPNNEATVPREGDGATQGPGSGLVIPLRALSRDGADATLPPEYEETAGRQGSTSTQPDTVSSPVTRPGTAVLHRSPSTRDLLRNERSQPNG